MYNTFQIHVGGVTVGSKEREGTVVNMEPVDEGAVVNELDEMATFVPRSIKHQFPLIQKLLPPPFVMKVKANGLVMDE